MHSHFLSALMVSIIISHVTTGATAQAAASVDQNCAAKVAAASEHALTLDEIRESLGLDDLNFAYFKSLYEKKMSSQEKEMIRLANPDGTSEGKLVAYPTISAPAALRRQFTQVDYNQLVSENFDRYAKEATLVEKKLQAGTGSSMTRQTYTSRMLGIDNKDFHYGAKGTDLYAPVKDSQGRVHMVPIAEAQILQAIHDMKENRFGGIILQDVVGPETKSRLAEIWQKKSLLDPNLTYAQLLEKVSGMARVHEVFQSHVPTLTEDNRLSFNRVAPAGHALFAVDALRAVIKPELRPRAIKGDLIVAISNGEDVNGTPDANIVGWMVKNRVPIALVTTDKTSNDMKGGLLSVVKNQETGKIYLKVLETAEAKAAGQQKLFEQTNGLMSTNLTLFNYDVLDEKLKGLSEDELLKIIAPDLILNWKEQKDSDGVTRKYLQLEGAMGSTIMNLDRWYREKFGEPLVQIVNVDRAHRTDFFSPIKSAFDFFMQFHSDRFQFDSVTMRVKNNRPGQLPAVALADPATGDKFYQDVDNVLRVFKSTKIVALDRLTVTGQVSLVGLTLAGRVEITNESGHEFSLSDWANQHQMTTLKDVVIHIDSSNHVSVKPL